ncbi:MAG TPA: hypothetical protein VLE47_04105 [Candidatus Saccharimonadales bacterium]|nr:hypothetical protein [Candidatus Saccharimonadales bacterium]
MDHEAEDQSIETRFQRRIRPWIRANYDFVSQEEQEGLRSRLREVLGEYYPSPRERADRLSRLTGLSMDIVRRPILREINRRLSRVSWPKVVNERINQMLVDEKPGVFAHLASELWLGWAVERKLNGSWFETSTRGFDADIDRAFDPLPHTVTQRFRRRSNRAFDYHQALRSINYGYGSSGN